MFLHVLDWCMAVLYKLALHEVKHAIGELSDLLEIVDRKQIKRIPFDSIKSSNIEEEFKWWNGT